MGLRRVWILVAMGAVSLLFGLLAIPTSAAADGTFSRTPASGPPGTEVQLASVTPCPAPPDVSPRVGDPDRFVAVFLDAQRSTFLGQIDVNDTTGAWAGTLTIPSSMSVGTHQLHPFCGRVVASAPCTGSSCLPRTDGPEYHFAYAPQPFTVCAAASSSCAPPGSLPSTGGIASSSSSSTSSTPGPTMPIPGPTLPTTSLPGATPTSAPLTRGPLSTSLPVFVPPETAPSGVPFDGVVAGTPTPGGTITVSEPGFTPGSPVYAVLYSSPVQLGTLVADHTGRATGTMLLPVSTPPGPHTLALFGGNLTKTIGLTVIGPSTSSTAAPVSTIPRTGPSTEPGDLAPPALLIAMAGALWLAAARQYRLAAGE